jgi:endoglycosylceramidase
MTFARAGSSLAWLVFASPLLTLACSKSPAGPEGGNDASVVPDTGALVEAGTEAGTEAGGDAGADAGSCTSPEFAGSPLGVHCNQLVDTQGRTVLLHGVNARVPVVFDVTFTDGRQPVQNVPSFAQADADRMRALGFNALRLPLNWSGIEPTATGGYSDTYLAAVAAVTAMCAKSGVYVLLDFHQDSYSKEIGEDGAPLWAIIPAPTQLLGGPLTGDRFGSAQVQDAYATFFGAPDAGGDLDAGVMLRARFAQMIAHVAAQFANDPAVMGFELYNEPSANDDQVWAFNAEMVPAIRAAAPQKLVLFEPPAVRNELDQASLGTGSIGAGTAYAPHVYTLAFTNEGATGLTEQSFAASNVNARAEADSWAAPLVITEFGWDPHSTNFVNWIGWQMDLEDRVLASSFFWLWKEDGSGNWGLYDFDANHVATERPATVAAMTRPRLEAAAGALEKVTYDPTASSLTVQFTGSANVSAPNVISIGAAATVAAAQWKATCDGAAVATGGSDPLQIPCSGAGEHTVVVSAH